MYLTKGREIVKEKSAPDIPMEDQWELEYYKMNYTHDNAKICDVCKSSIIHELKLVNKFTKEVLYVGKDCAAIITGYECHDIHGERVFLTGSCSDIAKQYQHNLTIWADKQKILLLNHIQDLLVKIGSPQQTIDTWHKYQNINGNKFWHDYYHIYKFYDKEKLEYVNALKNLINDENWFNKVYLDNEKRKYRYYFVK